MPPATHITNKRILCNIYKEVLQIRNKTTKKFSRKMDKILECAFHKMGYQSSHSVLNILINQINKN